MCGRSENTQSQEVSKLESSQQVDTSAWRRAS